MLLNIYMLFGKKLGRGGYSSVWMNNANQVIKVYLFDINDGLSIDCLKDIAIYKCMNILNINDLIIKNICTLNGREPHVCLITENGGENLQDVMRYNLNFQSTSNEYLYTREQFRSIVRQSVQALVDMNKLGIIHRDIKPLNMLISTNPNLSSDDSNLHLKVIDYGLASLSSPYPGEVHYTTYYRPPECDDPTIDDVIDIKADIWALGASLFEVLTGKVLIRHDMIRKVYYMELNKVLKGLKAKDKSNNGSDDIKHDSYFYPLFEYIRNFDEQLCDLLIGMLQVNPEHRLNLSGIIGHTYLNHELSSITLADPSKLPVLSNSKALIDEFMTKFSEIDDEYDEQNIQILENTQKIFITRLFNRKLLIDCLFNYLYLHSRCANLNLSNLSDLLFKITIKLFYDGELDIHSDIHTELQILKHINYELMYPATAEYKVQYLKDSLIENTVQVSARAQYTNYLDVVYEKHHASMETIMDIDLEKIDDVLIRKFYQFAVYAYSRVPSPIKIVLNNICMEINERKLSVAQLIELDIGTLREWHSAMVTCDNFVEDGALVHLGQIQILLEEAINVKSNQSEKNDVLLDMPDKMCK